MGAREKLQRIFDDIPTDTPDEHPLFGRGIPDGKFTYGDLKSILAEREQPPVSASSTATQRPRGAAQ